MRRLWLGMYLLAAVSLSGTIRGPGRYSGVVLFDRWDACRLYSGVYLMAVSEGVKASLRVYSGKAIVVDALAVSRPINPGDGLITKLRVLDEPLDGDAVAGVELRAIPSFPASGAAELVVEVRNAGRWRQLCLRSGTGYSVFLRPMDHPTLL